MADPVPSPATIVRGACPHDCPDTCAWQVTVTDGIATKLVGDPNHPFTRGGLCAKVNHYLDRVYSPDRVLHPLKRIGPKGDGRFAEVSWGEALADIGSRLQQVIAEDGPTAILPFSWMGTQGLLNWCGMDRRFFARLGATRLVRNVCGPTGGRGIDATIGAKTGMLPQDVVHSRFIIIWGTNTIVTNLHLWPFIREAKANGATVVVIDPVRTRTAQAADWHVQPRPGTDTALAMGMMQVIVEEALLDTDYVTRHTLGFEKLRERLADYTPGRVAEITGLAEEEVIRLARAYATSQPSAIRVLVGMEHRANGAMAFRTIACLPALVGAWRHRGGGLLYMTDDPQFAAMNSNAVSMFQLEDESIRSINFVQLGQGLTDPAMAPPIRALIVYNSNPAATVPNQRLVLEGLRRDDLFTVVHEQFLTDTTLFADYVLPATTQVEQLDLMWSWGHTILALNRPAIAPMGEAVSNTEFFRRLATRLGLDEPYLHTSDEEMVRAALDSDHPYLEGITYDRLWEEGWAPLNLPDDWRPFADGGFGTPSGKCEFWSESLAAAGLDPLPGYVPADESPGGKRGLSGRYPLSLVAAKGALHFLNSSFANLPHHLKAESEPWIDLNTIDADGRGIAHGDMVRAFNDRGEVTVRARVGTVVPAGTVSVPSGWWASLSPGGTSVNALTADGISDMGQGGDFHDTLVQVAASP